MWTVQWRVTECFLTKSRGSTCRRFHRLLKDRPGLVQKSIKTNGRLLDGACVKRPFWFNICTRWTLSGHLIFFIYFYILTPQTHTHRPGFFWPEWFSKTDCCCPLGGPDALKRCRGCAGSSEWLHNWAVPPPPRPSYVCLLFSVALSEQMSEVFFFKKEKRRLLSFFVFMFKWKVKVTSCIFLSHQAISNKDQHSISYTLSRAQTVVVEYTHDSNTDMFQVTSLSVSPPGGRLLQPPFFFSAGFLQVELFRNQ